MNWFIVRSTFCAVIVFGTLQQGFPSFGATLVGSDLFRDTFDRPDNNDIDAVTTGITNNTGTTFGASAVYSTPWVDPNNQSGGPDASAANGGGQRIAANDFQLKYNPGTANAFVNHNFTNADILAAGGFAVSLDVVAYNQATIGQGAAIAIGMSQAEALMGRDANDGSPALGAPGFKYTNAFQSTATTATVLSDFFLALRGTSTLAWGIGGAAAPAPTSVAVASKTGTISADFRFADFNAGSTVNYIVYYNGVSQGSGTFTWSGTNENYIGLDGRDNTVVRVDNFAITVPEPATVLLAFLALAASGWRRQLD